MELEKLKTLSPAIGWAFIGAFVIAWDVTQEQTLSAGVDRALEHKVGKYLAIGATVVTAAHLLNLPNHFGLEHLDPFKYLTKDLFSTSVASESSM